MCRSSILQRHMTTATSSVARTSLLGLRVCRVALLMQALWRFGRALRRRIQVPGHRLVHHDAIAIGGPCTCMESAASVTRLTHGQGLMEMSWHVYLQARITDQAPQKQVPSNACSHSTVSPVYLLLACVLRDTQTTLSNACGLGVQCRLMQVQTTGRAPRPRQVRHSAHTPSSLWPLVSGTLCSRETKLSAVLTISELLF
jgi:hypothetical protein